MTTQQKIAEFQKVKFGFSRNKLKYSVNEVFFDKWTSQMAYILGFTFADGNIHKTTLAWDVQKKDKNILLKIRNALETNYPISLHRKKSVRLRISNQLLIVGAIKRGLFPKKNIRNELPNVPQECLRHFVRGNLDGDGWITIRNSRNEMDVGFCSGNKEFLNDLNHIISSTLRIHPANLRERIKVTPKKVKSKTFMFEFYSANAYKIATWLFDNLDNKDLYLDRKYKKYLKAKKLYQFLNSGTKVVRVIQKRRNKPLREILEDLYIDKKYDGVKIGKVLNVHSSSIYRWLAKTGIKYPERRIYGQES